MLILVHSVEAKIIQLQLESAQQMWMHLRRRYQPAVDALHHSLLQQLRTLKQGGDTVEVFFDRFMDLWGKLDSLDVFQECACCVKRQQHDDKRELYEFLIRLRPEFEPAKTWLLGRSPLPSVIEARNALLIEEIRLQSAAPVVAPAEKKKRRKKKKKHSGGHRKLKSSEPSESSSPLPQNVVAGMVNRLQGLTHQESSGSTNLPFSRNSGSDHDWDCLL